MMITDGKAIDVVLTSAKEKNEPHFDGFFHGILMGAGSSGDTVAMEIAQRVHRITVAAELDVDYGDVLYIDASDGETITKTSSGNRKAFKAIEDKHTASNSVDVLILPQY